MFIRSSQEDDKVTIHKSHLLYFLLDYLITMYMFVDLKVFLILAAVS